MGAALDIVAQKLAEALSAERQSREALIRAAGDVASASVRMDFDDAPMRMLRDAFATYRTAVWSREQAERALKELTEEGPYR